MVLQHNEESVVGAVPFAAAGIMFVVSLVVLIYTLAIRVVRKAASSAEYLERQKHSEKDGSGLRQPTAFPTDIEDKHDSATAAEEAGSTTKNSTSTAYGQLGRSSTSLFADSLFSADDALGLDWGQVKLASQLARKTKKQRADKTPSVSSDALPLLQPPLAAYPISRSVGSPTCDTTTYAPLERMHIAAAAAVDNESTIRNNEPANIEIALAATTSTLRAAAPSWTPSGGYMFSLEGTLNTPKEETVALVVHEWQSASTKTGKNKRSKPQSYLLNTSTRRTSVNNPFALLEV